MVGVGWGRGRGVHASWGQSLSLGTRESSRDRWRGGGVASQCEGTTELTVHLKTVTMAHFRLSIFYHNLKKLEKNLGMKSS